MDKPWVTFADRPDRVLDRLVDEAAGQLRLTRTVVAKLRARIAEAPDAVLWRAQGGQRAYDRHKPAALWMSRTYVRHRFALWARALLLTAGFALLCWKIGGPLGITTGWRVLLTIALPALFVLAFRYPDEDELLVVGAGIFAAAGMLVGFIWQGFEWFPSFWGLFAGLAALFGAAELSHRLGVAAERNDWPKAITEAQRHFDEWVEMLYGLGVLPLVAEVSNTTTYATELPAHSRRLVDDVVVVDTDASRELARVTALSRGSFALAGPRGAGKSTLMAQWSASDPRDLTAIVHAPVGYKPEEFLVHLFTRMCDVVAQCGNPALRRGALAERDALRYVRSHTVEREGAFDAGLPFAVKLALKGKHALKRDEVPLNHPQRVDRFRLFLGHVADEMGKDGGRVLIGIDELDRISDGDQAQQFLNELKAVFGLPNCYFLVSVSEDALADFELAAMGMRTVFDSAFDAVVRVDYLRFDEAKTLLKQCMVDVPEQFVALAYVLSGGLARELTRIADVMGTQPHRSLTAVNQWLVRRQLARTTRAAMDRVVRLDDRAAGAKLIPVLDDEPPADLRAYATRIEQIEVGKQAEPTQLDVTVMVEYLATLTEVFDEQLDEARMAIGLTPGPGAFEVLARVRRYLGANPYGARELLTAFDKEWR